MNDQAKLKKKRKRPRDPSQLAMAIVHEATEGPSESSEDTHEALSTETEESSEKNPAAVALGKLGGKKGGPARAKKLSKERRKEIAKKAAEARWKNKSNDE